MCQNLLLFCGVLRIGIYTFFRRLCGYGPPPTKPNYNALCLGLAKSGKSTLLAVASGEDTEDIAPTVGFSIKALMFDDCIVDVKELGGADNIRPYWDKYFSGSEGVIFVVNSNSSSEDLQTTNTELHRALGDPELDDLPLMVLCNTFDSENAKSTEELTKILELELENGKRKWTIQSCSASSRDSLKDAFVIFNKMIMDSKAAQKNDNEDFSKI